MMNNQQYQTVASLVAAVFLLFNVGLPIVVASCPMAGTPTTTCGMCMEESNTQRVTTVKNTSCCATIFVAEKNSTEFVQTKFDVKHSLEVVAGTDLSPQSTHSVQNISTTRREFPPPTLPLDIPISTCSLLI